MVKDTRDLSQLLVDAASQGFAVHFEPGPDFLSGQTSISLRVHHTGESDAGSRVWSEIVPTNTLAGFHPELALSLRKALSEYGPPVRAEGD